MKIGIGISPAGDHPKDAVEHPREVGLVYQIINGGCYLTWTLCKRKSTLPENRGAPWHCAAGIPRDTLVTDERTGKRIRIFDGAVLAICPYSGMNEPGEDGKRRVHWGDGENTCSYPANQNTSAAQ